MTFTIYITLCAAAGLVIGIIGAAGDHRKRARRGQPTPRPVTITRPTPGKATTRKQHDPADDAVKRAGELRRIAALTVQSDKLTTKIAQSERKDDGLTAAYIQQQEAINAEIEARLKRLNR